MQRVTVSIVLFFGFLHVATPHVLLRGRHVVDENSACANSQCIGEPSTQSHLDSKRDSISYHVRPQNTDADNGLGIFDNPHPKSDSWEKAFGYWTTQPADGNWIAVWKADDTHAPKGDDYVAWAYAPGDGYISIPGFQPKPDSYKAYLLQWGNRQTPLAGPFEFNVTRSSLSRDPEDLKFHYSTSHPAEGNWIGIWKADDWRAPRGDNHVAWAFAPGSDTAIEIPELQAKPGAYKAYLLQEGNREFPLAGPVRVNVPKPLVYKNSLNSTLRYSTGYPAKGNWVGVWKADDASAPIGDNYTTWASAPSSDGEIDMPELQSQPGTYKAYLFQWGNRVTPLAGPTEFKVAAGEPPAPFSEPNAHCRDVLKYIAIAMGVGTTLRGGPAITLLIRPGTQTCPKIGDVKPTPIEGRHLPKCEYSLPGGAAQMTGTLSWVDKLANNRLRIYNQIREGGLDLEAFKGCADLRDLFVSGKVESVSLGKDRWSALSLVGYGNLEPKWCLVSRGFAGYWPGWFCTLSSLIDDLAYDN